MKRIITTLIAGALAALLMSAPAGAAILITTGDDGGGGGGGKSRGPAPSDAPSWVPPLTVSEVRRAASDPTTYVQELINNLRGQSASGFLSTDAPRGTAESGLTGVRIQLDDDMDIRLLDLHSFATLDAEYWNLPKNLSTANVAGATAFWRGMVRDSKGGPATVPSPPFHSMSTGKRIQHGLPEATVKIPDSATQGTTIDWENWADTAEFVLGLLGPGIVPNEAANALPGSDQDIVVNAGDLVDGVLEPGTLTTELSLESATAEAESEIDFARLLHGLTSVSEAGIGEHWARAGGTVADQSSRAVSRELTIKSITAVDLSALLTMLGLPVDTLPEPLRGALMDRLGVDVPRFNKAAMTFGSYQALMGRVTAAVSGVQAAVAAGTACGSLDSAVSVSHGVAPFFTAQALGLAVPGCLPNPLAAVNALRSQLEGYAAQLTAAIDDALEDAPLLQVTDVSANASAEAYIPPPVNGRQSEPILRPALPEGGGVLKAAGVHAPFDVNDASDTLNKNAAVAVTGINDVLKLLGPEYVDMVQVQLVERAVTQGYVDHKRDRVLAHAGVDLVRVTIDPPRVDPEDVQVRLAAAFDPLAITKGGGGAGGGWLGRPADPASVRPQSAFEPITITIGELDAVASFHRPGTDIPPPLCEVGTPDCNPEGWSTTKVSGPGSGGAPGLGEGDLPRTGASSGTMPVAVAGLLASLALVARRFQRHAVVALRPARLLRSPYRRPDR